MWLTLRVLIPIGTAIGTLVGTLLGAAQGGASGPGSWSDGPPLPVEIAEMAGAAIGPTIYTGGGFTPPAGSIGTWFGCLDTSDDSPAWERLTDMPVAVHHPGMAAGDGRIWLAGGYSGALTVSEATRTLFAYDPALDAWERKADLPGRRAAHFLVHEGGRLYAIGGTGDRTGSMFVYDIAADEWAEAPGPIPREHLGGAASGGLVYAIAGRGFGLGDRSAILESYDPNTGEWTRLSDMPGACGGCTAAATADGRIHVTGGETFGMARATYRDHYVYDPAAGTWSVAAEMPTARHGLASAAVGDRFYAIGGGRIAGLAYSSLVEVWSPGGEPPSPSPTTPGTTTPGTTAPAPSATPTAEETSVPGATPTTESTPPPGRVYVPDARKD